MGTAVTELVASVLKGELVAAINMPAIDGDLSEMKPFVSLAEKLARIYYQAESSPVSTISITYSESWQSKQSADIVSAQGLPLNRYE